MMLPELKTFERPLTDSQCWDLALEQYARVERAGHALRLALFSAAAGVFLLSVLQIRPGMSGVPLWLNCGAAVLGAVAALFLLKAWNLQREQAHDRSKYLMSGNRDALAQYDDTVEQFRTRNAAFWDRLAAAFVVVAAAISLALRVFSVSAALHV